MSEEARIPLASALQAALVRARDYAQAQSHVQITLEHVLLALTEDEDAAPVMEACTVDLTRLRNDVAGFLGSLNDRQPPGTNAEPQVSAPVTQILKYATLAAKQGRRNRIDGAIVLAALVGDGRSMAASFLTAQGLTFERAIQVLQRGVQRAPQPGPQPPAPHAPMPASPPPPQSLPYDQPPDDSARTGQTTADDILAAARERVEARNQAPPPRPSPPLQQPSAPPPPHPSAPPPPPPEALDRPDPSRIPKEDVRRDLSSLQREPRQPAPPPRPELAFEQAPPPMAAPEPLSLPPLSDGPPLIHQPALEQMAPPQPHVPQPMPSGRDPLPVARDRHEPPPQPQPAAVATAPSNQSSQTSSSYTPPPIPIPAPAAWSPPRPGSGAPMVPASQLQARPPQLPPPGMMPPARPLAPQPPQHQPMNGAARDSGRSIPPPPVPEVAPWPEWAEPQTSAPAQPPPMPEAPSGPAAMQWPAPPRGPAPPDPMAAQSGRPRERAIQPAQVTHNAPTWFKSGRAQFIEVRVARPPLPGWGIAPASRPSSLRSETVVARAISVRLRPQRGALAVDAPSIETQWEQAATRDRSSTDEAIWRFVVTPSKAGTGELVLSVSARTIGADAVMIETALPDQTLRVRVRPSLRPAMQNLSLIGLVTFGCIAVLEISRLVFKIDIPKFITSLLGL